MITKIIIAGSGGQGIMLLGKVLAETAMRKGLQVSWFPSYGAEVRGGSAHCMVVISDDSIGSPYIEKADCLVAMNNVSFEKFKDRIYPGALLIANSSFIKRPSAPKAKIISLDLSEEARVIGDVRIANMIALGVLCGMTHIATEANVAEAVTAVAPPGKQHLIEINLKALAFGFSQAQLHKGRK